MRTVLFITNCLPEERGGRAGRFDSRRRVLAELGWEVVFGYVPSTSITGMTEGLLRCLRLVADYDVDIVDSINNPPQLHVIGLLVGAIHGKPHVAEFLDSLATNPDIDKGSFSMLQRRALEWVLTRRTDRIVWPDGIQMNDDYLQQTYPSAPANRFQKLPPLGYERRKFKQAGRASFDRFTITYAGSFYDGWIEPYAFLDGLSLFRDACGISPADVRINFYGDWDQNYQRYAERTGVADLLKTHGRISHDEIIPILKGSDVLLAVAGTDPRNERALLSKTSDYVGARSPILAVVDPSFYLAKTVRETGTGLVGNPDEPADIAAALEQFYHGEFEYNVADEVFEQFCFETRMQQLAAVSDDITGHRQTGCRS